MPAWFTDNLFVIWTIGICLFVIFIQVAVDKILDARWRLDLWWKNRL
jgi:hypothetical protein